MLRPLVHSQEPVVVVLTVAARSSAALRQRCQHCLLLLLLRRGRDLAHPSHLLVVGKTELCMDRLIARAAAAAAAGLFRCCARMLQTLQQLQRRQAVS
jgi:hypothetical protein